MRLAKGLIAVMAAIVFGVTTWEALYGDNVGKVFLGAAFVIGCVFFAAVVLEEKDDE